MKLHSREIPKARFGGQMLGTNDFKIKASAEAFAILSSGLYSDPIRAIIRELSCNAWDAHIESNNLDTPFEVELPSEWSPVFRIRDYGTGLNHEQVTTLYTTYFESTKSDSNDQVGALGLGSKSPLGYTNNFVVNSFQDGVKRSYKVYLNDDGFPSLAYDGEYETDEGNGLEVIVPTEDSDFHLWENAANRVFQFFKGNPRPIVNEGEFEIPEHKVEETVGNVSVLKYEDRGHYYGRDTWHVRQGNVGYPIDFSQLNEKYAHLSKISAVIDFEIGTVMMAPNRESLNYNDRTIKAIEESLEDFVQQHKNRYIEHLDQLTTYSEVSKKLEEDLLNRSYNHISAIGVTQTNENQIDILLHGIKLCKKLFEKETGIKNKTIIRRYVAGFDDEIFNKLGNRFYNLSRLSLGHPWRGLLVNNPLVRGLMHKHRDSIKCIVFNNRTQNISLFDKNGKIADPWVPSKVESDIYDKFDCITTDGAIFVINDIDRRMVKALRSWMKKNDNYNKHRRDVIFINKNLDKNDIKSLEALQKQLPDCVEIKYASEMELPFPQRGTNKATGEVRITRLRRRRFTSHEEPIKWEKGLDLKHFDDGTTRYWVTVKGHEITDMEIDGKNIAKDPKRFLHRLYKLTGITEIYCVREHDVDKIRNKKLKGWKHLKSHFYKLVNSTELTKEYRKMVTAERYRYFRKLGKYIDANEVKNKKVKAALQKASKTDEPDSVTKRKVIQTVEALNGFDLKNINAKNITEKIDRELNDVYNSVPCLRIVLKESFDRCFRPDPKTVNEVRKLIEHFS